MKSLSASGKCMPAYEQSRMMKAIRCEPVDTTPVWIMRQAGRYLPEYMAVRSKVTFIELCKTPEIAAEVTLTAQQVLGVDAAILFADLLPMLQPMGMNLTYEKGEGPKLHNPLRTSADVDRFQELENVDELEFVFDAVKLIRADLPEEIPLLGFAGAPFTLASYAIEGSGSKNYIHTKTMMYTDPGKWDAIMSRLSNTIIRYLTRQFQDGCQAVQLFDSWAGCLSPDDYRQYVLPYTKRIIATVSEHGPVINFLTGNPALLPLQKEAGGRVMGIDWRCDLKEARELFGYDVAVQGNLDPVTLFADIPTIREKAKVVMDKAAGRPGHIFNLGHGVMPDMKPENVKALVNIVHELGASR
ncbi:uroporphyrinogen decarboxylase [Rubinisphaera italica]|uniref:Uroporphyrinogen decarboxylase n=1 Tax=Rubinisphaera italica TaxID=2527969 RepID=A0A5C5XIZ1_9PLAN|nr:uroporphyrinogen decarboxylase [Rubinisphaera italica]TWT62754.1 Uroporphyrinogen decarboxylase [Rubinisphaera italica]